MARSRIPDPLERRHVIERSLAPAQAERVAEAYLGESRRLEALVFLGQAGAQERLAELRRQAIDEGDAFLLRAVANTTGEPPRREEWLELAAAAEAAGKERYAADARRQAERGEE
jgi:hypothetical protein